MLLQLYYYNITFQEQLSFVLVVPLVVLVVKGFLN